MACLRVNIEARRKRDALLCVPFSDGSEQTGLSGRDANIRRPAEMRTHSMPPRRVERVTGQYLAPQTSHSM